MSQPYGVSSKLQIFGVDPSQSTLITAPPDRPPHVTDMLEVAIVNGNPGIVSFLLETYERINLYSLLGVMDALLLHPDLPILEALYKHNKDVINLEWDNHTTFVNEACNQSLEKIAPLILFAVEHDAHLGGRYLFGDMLLEYMPRCVEASRLL